MGKNTEIAWTDHTWNPWQGCQKISTGCKNCYMFREKKRWGQDPEDIHRSSMATFRRPFSWKYPAMVFTCSWSDFFLPEADPWRDDAWQVIRSTPHLTYQILTKRSERIKECLPDDWPLKNVWLGVTVESDLYRIERLNPLMDVPAAVRFVSVEPMIGPVDLGNYLCRSWSDGGYTMGTYLDWVIVGGESGPGFRKIKTHWIENILRDCKSSNTPFFMKQMAGVRPKDIPIPDHLNIREFPK